MRRLLSKITLISLILVMVFSLAACSGGNEGNSDSNKDELATAEFTISFDSQGGSTVEPQKVKNGSYAVRPENPVKPGYDFVGWNLNSNPYKFDEVPVTKNLTLTAIWTEKKLNHTIDKASGLNFIPNTYPGYHLASAGNINGVVDYTYQSTYGKTSTLPILLAIKDGTTQGQKPLSLLDKDYFVYFYTIEFDKEVRFSTWANKPTADMDLTKDSAKVTELNEYRKADGTTLYLKWHSQLPSISIKVDENDNTLDPNWINGKDLNSLKYHDQLIDLKGIIYNSDKNKDIEPTRAGYEFNGWNYVLNDKETPLPKDSLKFMDETILTKDEVTGNNPESYTLTIKPSWRKSVVIETEEQFLAFADEVAKANTAYNNSKLDADKLKLQEYCEAKITMKGNSFDFADKKGFAPMFSEEFPFKGDFVNVTDNNSNCVIKNLKLTNSKNSMSLFGNIEDAIISNFTFENVFFVYNATLNDTDDLYVATIANKVLSGARIENCNFIKTNYDKNENNEKKNKDAFNLLVEGANLNYGIIATKLETATIKNCKVNVLDDTFLNKENANIRVTAGSCLIGAIAAENKHKTLNVPETGSNVGDIRICMVDADFYVNVSPGSNITNAGKLVAGGIVGQLTNSAVISSTKYVGTLNMVGHKVKVGALVGYLNSSKITNSYAEQVTIVVGNNDLKANGYVYSGGLIGHAMRPDSSKVVLSDSYINYGKPEAQTTFENDNIILNVTNNCKVYNGALIGNANKIITDNCFSMVPVVQVNVYKDNALDDNLTTILSTVHLGYLYAEEKVNLNTSSANHTTILMDDTKDGDNLVFKEHIKINNFVHTITLEQNGDKQENKSNFNINLNVTKMNNTTFFNKEEVVKSELYKRFAEAAEALKNWSWTAGSTPKLIYEVK